MKIGVLCGYQMPGLLQDPETIQVETPYGEIMLHAGSVGAHEVFFIRRHGDSVSLPPHTSNYLGNISAFAVSHVSRVFSIGTVWSMKKKIHPSDLLIPHDFIDATKQRVQTFFDDRRVHVDMSEPFCSSLRDSLRTACRNTRDVRFHTKGVYLVNEGPRLETASEIRVYSKVADVVGMTLAPEVVLAREKGMCFVSLCLVSSFAAGLQKQVSAAERTTMFMKKEPMISSVVRQAIASLDENDCCECPGDLSKASV